VFQLADMEVPAEWSQVACDILAQKYFRKAGIPARLKPVEETDVPAWLWRRAADGDGLADLSPAKRSEARAQRQASLRPPCRDVDLLGLERRLFRRRG